jgi:hypothetical protein
VIAVFTKYDQFKIDIEIQLEDNNPEDRTVNEEMKMIFQKEYLGRLGTPQWYICLKSENLLIN